MNDNINTVTVEELELLFTKCKDTPVLMGLDKAILEEILRRAVNTIKELSC